MDSDSPAECVSVCGMRVVVVGVLKELALGGDREVWAASGQARPGQVGEVRYVSHPGQWKRSAGLGEMTAAGTFSCQSHFYSLIVDRVT